MSMRLLALFATALAALLLSSCSAPEDRADSPPVVLAAASLQEAVEDATQVWQQKGHAAPTLAFAASSALARQVEGGVPADIYISADEEWMDELQQRGLIYPDTREDLLSNSLVLIAPADGAEAAALDTARLALADPDAVPAGRYARAALESLGLWSAVAPRVVPAENVRAALALVERGEVQLGIVYATDALASRKVRVIRTFPADSHPPILYPAALLKSSESADARAFLAFLRSDQARAIFARRGFGAAE